MKVLNLEPKKRNFSIFNISVYEFMTKFIVAKFRSAVKWVVITSLAKTSRLSIAIEFIPLKLGFE